MTDKDLSALFDAELSAISTRVLDKSEHETSVAVEPGVHADCTHVDEAPLQASHALSQRTRPAIFRLLVCNEPEGMWVGAIARQLGAPQNTISAHLSSLHRAKLVKSERRGRSVAYRTDLRGMQSLFEYLGHDCCHGDAALCAAVFGSARKRGCAETPTHGSTDSRSTEEMVR